MVQAHNAATIEEETRTVVHARNSSSTANGISGKGSSIELIRWVSGYVLPHRATIAIITACLLTGTLASLASPYCMKLLIDHILRSGSGTAREVLSITGALIALQLLVAAMSVVQGRLAAPMASRIVHDLRSDFFEAVQQLSLSRHDSLQSGQIISRLVHDTLRLQFFIEELSILFVPQLLLILGVLTGLFLLSWPMALVTIAPVPLALPLAWLFHTRVWGRYSQAANRLGKMTARASDSIAGIRDVKCMGRELAETAAFRQRSQLHSQTQTELVSTSVTVTPIARFLVVSGGLAALCCGSLGVIGQAGWPWRGITVGTLAAFLSYVALLHGPFLFIAQLGGRLSDARTVARRLFEIVSSEKEVYCAPGACALDITQAHLCFDNVSFGYYLDRPVLQAMSFDAGPGEIVGLVGKSGVGKTTVAALICRFYDAWEGEIKINGQDIRQVKLRDLRRHIGVVPQSPYLFDATIAENIAVGKPGASRDEIVQAAVAANAHDFIMRRPDGYDSMTGQGGRRLSGGERQLIAIARAVLRNPRILILDEATSAVDSCTEELLQSALAKLAEGRTTIAIAHRLSTLRNAHRLLVIEDGTVAESGTHEELIARKGRYYDLLERQSRLSTVRSEVSTQ